MNCFSKKTVFNFYEVSTCHNCKYKQEDYYFNIGRGVVNIYYLRHCYIEEVDLDYLFSFSKKAKLFLKDMILNYDKGIFLIMDDFIVDRYMDDLEILLEVSDNIHILVV